MEFKTFATLAIVAIVAEMSFGQFLGPTKANARAQAKMKARQVIYEKLGGEVKMPDKTPAVRFLNCQKKVALNAIEPALRNIRTEFNICVVTREGAFSGLTDLLKTAVVADSHVATVALVDVDGLPWIVAMPDSFCAIVNVRAIMIDKPTQQRLEERAAKLAYRAFGMAMGACWTAQGIGLLRPAETLKELDALAGRASPPDCHFGIATQCRNRNVAMGGYTTYQDACLDGWAPAPTNAVQKRIWEDVKSGKIKD